MCWSLVKNKQYAEAEERANQGLQVSPYDLRLIEILGEAKYYLGKNSGAMEQFQRYVAGAPDSGARVGVSYYYMGEIFIRQARYQHADIALSSAVKKEPLLDSWWTRLGYAREMAGNYKEAIMAYDEALKLNPKYREAINEKAQILEALNRKDEALNEYKKVIALFFAEYQARDTEDYSYETAVLLDNGELVDELIRQLRQHIQKYPAFADGYYKLGQALEAKGLKNEAMMAFRKALEINPSYEIARKCFWKR